MLYFTWIGMVYLNLTTSLGTKFLGGIWGAEDRKIYHIIN